MKHYDTVLLCLHLMVGFCGAAACNLPTESDPFSLCAYCSDRRAGVRWMMHESNNQKGSLDPDRYDGITIEFQCRDPQNDTVYQHDDCFDGTRLSELSFYDPGEWYWYILERELNNGTECSFVTTLEHGIYLSTLRLDASTCKVEECSEDSSDTDCALTSSSPIPAICSAEGEPMDSECSCSCNNPAGLTTSQIHGTTILQCKMTPCVENYFLNASGNCEQCPRNSMSSRDASVCTCSMNYTTMNGNRMTTGEECVCGENYHIPVGSNQCVQCPANSLRAITSQSSVCTCESNHLAGNGSTITSGSVACDVCVENYFLNAGGNCELCPRNSMSTRGDNVCTCSMNYTTMNGSRMTTGEECVCGENYHIPVGSDQCVQCPANSLRAVTSPSSMCTCESNRLTGNGSTTTSDSVACDGTSMQVPHSPLISDPAHVTEAGADIKFLIAIPLSVVVLIVLVVISLLFIIALNKYRSNDSVHKSISSWQAQDKFDPEFTPAVEIDRNFSVKYSPTQESIVMSLKHITDEKGEHELCTDQDAEKESITSRSPCNNESHDNNIITTHDPTIIQSNGATDSGIVLSSDQNQNSSNYQDKSASSSPSTSLGYVTEPRCSIPVHPSGEIPGYSQTQAWSFCDSGYKTELESQNPLEPLTGHGGTTTDEYVHEHAQLQISIAVNSSNSASPELDEMNGILSASSESSSCFHDIHTTLTPDDHDATDDHMINTNADSTGCNISAKFNDYATQLQMPCSEITENYSSIRQSGRGIPLGSYTNTMRLPGMDGSSLSIMCDTDFQDSIDTSTTCII